MPVIAALSHLAPPPVSLALAERRRRLGPPKTLAEFAKANGFIPAAHHQIICDALDKCASEGNQRIMIFLPPGSAKSTYASILFPAYYVSQFPKKKIIAACHTADLADYFGGEVRGVVNSEEFKLVCPGLEIVKGNAARSEWKTTNGSSYKGAGIGGPLSGRRADLLLIDDPVKDDEAASSPVQRSKVLEWYRKVARTRLKPGGSIIVIMTRWHEEDLAGALLSMYEGWKQIVIRMECEDEDDPLGRQIGERLWPEYFTELDVKEAKIDIRTWISLYQQRPTPMEGNLFKVDRIEVIESDNVPDTDRYCAHDWAATEGGGDWTAFACLRRDKDGFIYLDIMRFQHEPFKRNTKLQRLAKAVQPVAYRIPEEIGIGGKEAAELFRRELVKQGVYTGTLSKISGDKAVRAQGLIAAVNAGLVKLIKSDHSYSFIQEARIFTGSGDKHDDMIDAASDAYNEMMLHEVGKLEKGGSRVPRDEEDED